MNLLRFIHKKYPFHPLVWYLIIETGIARGAFYMAMPFVALRMYSSEGTAPATIGAVVGVGPLVAIIVGFYVGHLSDRWGRRSIILVTMLMWSIVLFCLSFAQQPYEYAILIGLSGLFRGIFEPVAAALIGDLCEKSDASGALQKSAFHLRYFVINIGATVGPMIGATLLIAKPQLGFQIAALVYLLSAISFSYFSNRFGVKALERMRIKATHAFADVLKVLSRDKFLKLYLFASFCTCLGFSQIETNLAIFLKQNYADEGVKVFGRLLTLNGALVVLVTLPLLKLVKKIDLNLSCAASALVWSIGFIVLSFSQTSMHYYLSMVIMSVAEIILFANGYLIIESLAPKKMRGAYMGTVNLSQAGIVMGPLVGGLVMQSSGGRMLFMSASFLLLISAITYSYTYQHRTEF